MGLMGAAAGAAVNYGISRLNRKNSKDDQKEMANYNYDLEMKKWNETNYDAQGKQMDKAGLSRSLMYGGSGAGGTTPVGTTQGGGSQESGKIPTMDIAQLSLLKAQEEKLKAETVNIETNTGKQGVETKGVGIDNDVKSLSLSIQNETYDVSIEKIEQSLLNMRADEITTKWTGVKTAAQVDNVIADTLLKGDERNLTKEKALGIVEGLRLQAEELGRKGNRDKQDLHVAEEQMKTYLIGQGINAGGRLLSDLIRLYKPSGAIGRTLTETFKDGKGGSWKETTKYNK